MDFNRTQQPGAAPSAHNPVAGGRKAGRFDDTKLSKFGFLGLVVALVVLLLAVLFVTLGSDKNGEQKFVDKGKLQAVFLNTGQVYFGNVKELNSRYFVLDNIYYLQTSNTGTAASANTSVSLVKLGCELHSPFDQMLINRTQVTFWENLQDSGQVAKAVKTFKQQNPSGQKCSDTATNASTTNTVQGSTNGSGASTTTTTKP